MTIQYLLYKMVKSTPSGGQNHTGIIIVVVHPPRPPVHLLKSIRSNASPTGMIPDKHHLPVVRPTLTLVNPALPACQPAPARAFTPCRKPSKPPGLLLTAPGAAVVEAAFLFERPCFALNCWLKELAPPTLSINARCLAVGRI